MIKFRLMELIVVIKLMILGGVGWNAPGGPYAWGYCFTEQIKPPSDYLDKKCKEYPCVPGQKYYGRGPIQLTW